MRSGKTENAMGAPRMARRVARRIGRSLPIVEAKFKARRADIRGCGQRKPAKSDEETLRCNGVGDDQAQQGPSKPLGYCAKSQHAPSLLPRLIMRTADR